MRVVCLVPSLTETLIESGIQVVGRTRFCIHPKDAVQGIVAIGGTKNVDWLEVKKLKPDLVIFDQEENKKEMADSCPFPWMATHVNSLETLLLEFGNLAGLLNSEKLRQLQARLQKILNCTVPAWNWEHIPGLLQKLPRYQKADKIYYIIWKDPWMSVGEKTFIFSILKFLGAPVKAFNDRNYPEMESLNQNKENFYLFSSEPFPFAKNSQLLADYNGALVDGENYSWFGIRAVVFLESILQA